MSLQLFNLDIYIVYNEWMAVASFGPSDLDSENKRKDSQLLVTRYYFSQFWCEFTADVLKEFTEEDYIYKEEQMDSLQKGGY